MIEESPLRLQMWKGARAFPREFDERVRYNMSLEMFLDEV